MYWILTASILFYIVLLGGLTALFSRKHSWIVSLMRIGVVAVSVVASVPLSKLVADLLGDYLYTFLEGSLNADMLNYMNDVPLAANSIRVIATLLVAPIIFTVLFVVIRLLLSVVIWILRLTVPALSNGETASAASISLGAVNGVLIALITLIPLCGYITLANTTMESLTHLSGSINTSQEQSVSADYELLASDSALGDTMDILEEVTGITGEIASDPMVSVMDFVGKPLFTWMTSGRIQGKNGQIPFSLTQDLPHLADSCGHLLTSVEALTDGEMTQQDKEEVSEALQDVLSSTWVAELAAESIGHIADVWIAGDDFLSIKAPDLGPMLQPLMDSALRVLSTENAETLRRDVDTVAGIVLDLSTMGFLDENPDYEKLMKDLGDTGLLTDLLKRLESNVHLAPLSTELRSLSVRVVSVVLGDKLKETDEYDPMIGQVADELNKVLDMPAEERKEIIKTSVQTAFVDYGVEVPEDLAVELSEQAIEELGTDGEITQDELKDYFINHMDEGLGLADDIIDDDFEIPDIGDDFEIPDIGE